MINTIINNNLLKLDYSVSNFSVNLIEFNLLTEVFLGLSCILILVFYICCINTNVNFKNSYVLLKKPLITISTLTLVDGLILIYNDNLIWLYNYNNLCNTISQNFLVSTLKMFLLFITLFCFLILENYIVKHKINHSGEYYIILLFSLLGLLLMIASNDLLCIFLAIEMQSLAFYILAAFKKESLYSVENGLKYLVLGALSSSFFLFGSCYLYGLTGLYNIFDFNIFWFTNQVPNQISSYLIFWETNNITLLILCSVMFVSSKFLHFLYLCLYAEFNDIFEMENLSIFLGFIEDELQLYTNKDEKNNLNNCYQNVEIYRLFTPYGMLKKLTKEIRLSEKEGDTMICEFSPISTYPGSDIWALTIHKLNFLDRLHENIVFFKNAFDSYDVIETISGFIDNAFDFMFKDYINNHSFPQGHPFYLFKKNYEIQKSSLNNKSYDLLFKDDFLFKNSKYRLRYIFDRSYVFLVPYMTLTEIMDLIALKEKLDLEFSISEKDFLNAPTLHDDSAFILYYASIYPMDTIEKEKKLLCLKSKEMFSVKIIDRLIIDNNVFFWYLQNVWKDELLGENLCLNDESVETDNYQYYSEFFKNNTFFDFKLFILHSFSKTLKILNNKMEHLQTVKKISNLLLSESKSEEVCDAIIKVGKKNPVFETKGNEIFFEANNKRSVSFISSFIIDLAIADLKKEIARYGKDFFNFCILINACDSLEFNYALKKVLNDETFFIFDNKNLLSPSNKCIWMPDSWYNYLSQIFFLRILSERALPTLEKDIATLEEILFYLVYRTDDKISNDMLSTFKFYDPRKEDKILESVLNYYFKRARLRITPENVYVYRITAKMEDFESPETKFACYIPMDLRAYCLMKLDILLSELKKKPSLNIKREIDELVENQRLSNYAYYRWVKVCEKGLFTASGDIDYNFIAIVFSTTCYECVPRSEYYEEAKKADILSFSNMLSYNLFKHEYYFNIILNNTVYSNNYLPILLKVYALELLQNETIKAFAYNQTYSFSTISLIFILISLLFKLAAAPFHYWSIDVYEGAPTSSTFIFTVIPKLSIIVLMIKLYLCSFYFFFINNIYQYVILSAFLSIFISSISGISEKKLKSLFAYSAINNLGYILFSMTTGIFTSLQSLYFYLFIYTVSNFVIWAIFLSLQVKKVWYKNKINKDFTDLLALKKTNPVLVFVFKLVLVSIAGIPPLVGFLAKLHIFLVTVEASLYLMSIIIIIFNLVSTFYYLRILKILYFEKAFLGKLYENITLKQSYIICFFFYFLLYLFINPWFIILSSYKITLY
jgi:NADH:ubiquinone oxidoreductase subunit 2 (subunit N)